MKAHTGKLSSITFHCAAVLSLLFNFSGCATWRGQSAAEDLEGFTNATAVVRAVRGEAFRNDGNPGEKVQVGSAFTAGSGLRTTAGTSVDLFLGENGPVVRVTEKSSLRFEELGIKEAAGKKIARTRLFLGNGRILGNVKATNSASVYEVRTPVCRISKIQGQYDLSAGGVLTMIEGNLLYQADGTSTLVQTGQTVMPPSRSSNSFPKRKF